jgi:transposase
MKLATIGIDLGKNVFQVHGVDENCKAVLRKQLRRNKVLEFFANLTPCLIGMEACAGASYWARELEKLGHTPKLMAPQYVKPYVKTNKTDAADAEAICEAVQRPSMRFVPIKNEEQQATLAIHRARQGFVKARTAQANQIRGFLAEYGIVMPKGRAKLGQLLPDIIEDAGNGLPYAFRGLLQRLFGHLNELDNQAHELELQILAWHRQNEMSAKLADIPGVGPMTASAIVATIGNGKSLKNGRQFAAWLGLVPRQHSTGGKARLLGISKRGDGYLRKLLIHGARAVVTIGKRRATTTDQWIERLSERRHTNIVSVALANKTARVIWAMLAHNRKYMSDFVPAKL